MDGSQVCLRAPSAAFILQLWCPPGLVYRDDEGQVLLRINHSGIPRSDPEFPSSSPSIRMPSSFPCAPLGVIAAVRQPFIPPCRFFLLRPFRVALAMDLLLCSFRGS